MNSLLEKAKKYVSSLVKLDRCTNIELTETVNGKKTVLFKGKVTMDSNGIPILPDLHDAELAEKIRSHFEEMKGIGDEIRKLFDETRNHNV